MRNNWRSDIGVYESTSFTLFPESDLTPAFPVFQIGKTDTKSDLEKVQIGLGGSPNRTYGKSKSDLGSKIRFGFRFTKKSNPIRKPKSDLGETVKSDLHERKSDLWRRKPIRWANDMFTIRTIATNMVSRAALKSTVDIFRRQHRTHCNYYCNAIFWE
jgi:hypothetical protein